MEGHHKYLCASQLIAPTVRWHFSCISILPKGIDMQLNCRRYLSLFLFACMITTAQAQKKDFYRGYIIHPEGDTLEGWVKDRSSGTFMKLYTRIHFKPDKGGKRKYGPGDILAYSANGQFYESVPVVEASEFFRFTYPVSEDIAPVFLKVLAREADLTYYHWEYVDAESNYLDFIPLFYRDGFYEMVRVTQGILGLKRNRLASYFSDCPDLVNYILAKQLNETYEVFDFYLDRCVDW